MDLALTKVEICKGKQGPHGAWYMRMQWWWSLFHDNAEKNVKYNRKMKYQSIMHIIRLNIVFWNFIPVCMYVFCATVIKQNSHTVGHVGSIWMPQVTWVKVVAPD